MSKNTKSVKKADSTKTPQKAKDAELPGWIKDPRIIALIFLITVYIACIVIWPLLDLLWCKLISHSEFIYNPFAYLIEPIFISIVATLVFNLKPIIKFYKDRKRNK